MGSLSLPRNGFPVGHSLEISDPFARELGLSQVSSLISVSLSREHVYCVVFVPFTREHIYNGGSILPIFRSEIGDGSSVPGIREHGSDPFLKDHDYFIESNMPGLKGAARVDIGFRKASGCWGSACVGAFPTQECRIGVVISRVHDLDLRGSESRAPDPSDLRLDPQGSIKAMLSVEISGVTKLIAKSWVPNPIFKSMLTPVTRSLGLISDGSPLS